MKLKDFFKEDDKGQKKEYKNKKPNVNALLVILVGVVFLITGSFFKNLNTTKDVSNNNVESNENKNENEENVKPSEQNFEQDMQEKLKSTLEKIEGVGKVEVMINFESGEEKVPAVNINNSVNNATEKDNEGGTRNTTQKNNGSTVVITNNGEKTEPLIVKEYKPKVMGICIVAQGAEHNITKLRISKAVVDLFDIPECKVNVYPMKK